MFYYKVVSVRRSGNREYLESPIALGKNKIRYFKSKVTTAPEGTRIFLFTSLYKANCLKSRHPSFQVWKCSIIDVGGIGNIAPVTYASRIDAYWKAIGSGKDTSRFSKVNGSWTISAKSIKLIEKMP